MYKGNTDFNRGDTSYLLLDYTLNAEPLVENAYDEMEFQINHQSGLRSIKKLLSKNEITWGSFVWEDKQHIPHSFTGYAVHLSQEDTFKLKEGTNEVQLRILLDGEVSSSKWTPLDVGKVLSNEVLTDAV